MRVARLLLLSSLALAAAGCGDDTPTEPVVTTAIAVRDDFFEPQNATVAAGATVTWTWNGSNPHNVTWVSAGLGDSPTQTSGSYSATMPSATGALAYYCTIHGTPTSGMRGTVTVQ
ncbi:MAG: plastocyanin/azurin family copper-binding protein [Gemmatimonadales bacterium]